MQFSEKTKTSFVVIALLAANIIFFYRYLATAEYTIPWDLQAWHFPSIRFIADGTRAGSIPLWNPYVSGGMPEFSNIQTGTFYPLQFVIYFMSGLGIEIKYRFIEAYETFHYLLASVFAYAFCRQLNLRKSASLIGGLFYAYGGLATSQMQHLAYIQPITWLPLWALFTHRLGRKVTWFSIAGLAATIGASLLSGHAPALITSLVILVVYALAEIISNNWIHKASMAKSLAGFGLGCSLGIMVGMIQLLPTIETSFFAAPLTTQAGVSPIEFVTFTLADVWGHLNPPYRFTNRVDFTLTYYYFGIAALLLMGLALLQHRSRNTRIWALMLFICGVACMDNVIMTQTLYSILPTQALLIRPYDFVFMLNLAIAILAAIGFNSLSNRAHEHPSIKAVISVSIICGILLALSGYLGANAIPGYGDVDASRILRQMMESALVLALCAGLIVLALRLVNQHSLGLILGLLIVFVFADLYFHNSAKSFNSVKRNPEFAIGTNYLEGRSTHLIEFLQSTVKDDSRVSFDNKVFGLLNGPKIWKFQSITGYDPLAISNYLEFNRIFADALPWERIAALREPNSPLLDMLGARYLVTANIPGSLYSKVDQTRYRIVFNEYFTVFERIKPVSRAFVTPNVVVIQNKQAQLAALKNMAEGDRQIVLDKTPECAGLEPTTSIAPCEDCKIKAIKNSNDRVDLKVASPIPAMVFLADVYYPGWQAAVDGNAVPIYPANYTFRAVCVPAGEHTITMTFRPSSFFTGFLTTAIASLIILIGSVLAFFLKARKPV